MISNPLPIVNPKKRTWAFAPRRFSNIVSDSTTIYQSTHLGDIATDNKAPGVGAVRGSLEHKTRY